jgi:hypothetical protein
MKNVLLSALKNFVRVGNLRESVSSRDISDENFVIHMQPKIQETPRT